MRLLFDQNISYKIIRLIADNFPDAVQVKRLGLENKSDKEIWNYAKLNNYTIVTYDADFVDFANLFGSPPKIIWHRTCNISNNQLAEFIISKSELIKDFIDNRFNEELACLELRSVIN